MTFNTDSQLLSEKAQRIFQSYSELGIDARLALLYLIYEQMGESITPAAPVAADPQLAPVLLGDFYQLAKDEQLSVMREIVNREDTEYSRAYGGLRENNQLAVWYAWAKGMGDTVVGMPDGYQPTEAINSVLEAIEGLEFQEQISVLRLIAGSMGYSEVEPIPTQAETGKTSSL
ncbi:orange carotenoid protein N-terminal domain-containing protein [Leptolyngbya ohadii]|uniref:orange carotenoid protein N-terminal domain-containing protein n=1 Tax=Leptolyngbya ohadii TaxID=1962290 RepID=UPI000B59B3AA|nr:orange carotenoid protein N-terminal domain-containing protein [Leptolyngbya ohadii]